MTLFLCLEINLVGFIKCIQCRILYSKSIGIVLEMFLTKVVIALLKKQINV